MKEVGPNFDDKVEKCIPAQFFMISSSQDHQTSNEAYNASAFELPDPAGKAGGASTSALLDVFYTRGHDVGYGISWVEILKDMHAQLKESGFDDQVPQLSSSRWIDVTAPMYICPPKSGVRRALLVRFTIRAHKCQGAVIWGSSSPFLYISLLFSFVFLFVRFSHRSDRHQLRRAKGRAQSLSQ